MPIEALDLGEEADLERVAIEHADRIVRIDGRDEPIARVADRLEVTRRDEAADARHREVLHRCRSLCRQLNRPRLHAYDARRRTSAVTC